MLINSPTGRIINARLVFGGGRRKRRLFRDELRRQHEQFVQLRKNDGKS